MDKKNIKFILINNENQHFMYNSLREIEKNHQIDHSYLSKKIRKKIFNGLLEDIIVKGFTIYKIIDNDCLATFCKLKPKYFLVNQENIFSIHKSLREIESIHGIDHSSLSKILRGKKYKTIGAGNRGRPANFDINKPNNENEKQKGFQIFKVF